jgi:hypothetical protein
MRAKPTPPSLMVHRKAGAGPTLRAGRQTSPQRSRCSCPRLRREVPASSARWPAPLVAALSPLANSGRASNSPYGCAPAPPVCVDPCSYRRAAGSGHLAFLAAGMCRRSAVSHHTVWLPWRALTRRASRGHRVHLSFFEASPSAVRAPPVPISPATTA